MNRRRTIPVARPKMPNAEDLLPYLRQIDANRIYTNWGPLNAQLEARLGEIVHANVLTASSATDGITCALLALLEDRPQELRRGLCLMPSWTFVATPHAAMAAGLTPCFLDVDEVTWCLTPEIVRQELMSGRFHGERIAGVVVVAPFGQQIDPGPWDTFTAETGIPVVIDAAAAFDGLRVGRNPAVVSLHATKSVGAGEGGFVATRDAELSKRIKRVANFGFLGTRMSEVPATNAKLSEYHAAAALCSLDLWDARRQEFMAVAIQLRDALEPMGVGFQASFGTGWVSATCVVKLPLGFSVQDATIALGLHGISTRAWWGHGCHTNQAFSRLPRRNYLQQDQLPVTARLADATIGLPFFCDMTADDVAQIRAGFKAMFEQGEAMPVQAPPKRLPAPDPLDLPDLCELEAEGRR